MDNTPQNQPPSDEIQLNLTEVGTGETLHAPQKNNTFKIILITFAVAVAAIIAYSVYGGIKNRSVIFLSNDATVSLRASTEWTTGKIIDDKIDKDTFCIPILSLVKTDSTVYANQISVMRIVTDTKGQLPEQIYAIWKDNYEYHRLFDRTLKPDRDGKTIPSVPQKITTPNFDGYQVEFDEKNILDGKMSHFITVIPTQGNYYIIEGVCMRSKTNAFLEEYNKIWQTLDFN